MTTTVSEISESQKALRKQYADGLREVADWIESTEMDLGMDLEQFVFSPKTFYVFVWDKDDFNAKSSTLGGLREKVVEGSYAITRRWFGPHKVEVNINREQVCERVQVGERTVPAQEAVAEHVEPVYKWQCEGFTVTT